MSQRVELMDNGAVYDARGQFFYVPEENLQRFLKRFPINNDRPLAQMAETPNT
jgi:hypothetical protein